MQRFPVCESHRRTKTEELPSKWIKGNCNKISFFLVPWIFYCWFTFMMMCTQPGEVSVSIKEEEKRKTGFIHPPSICTVTNGDSARPARCELIGHTGNKEKGEREHSTFFSYLIFIGAADGSAQSFCFGGAGGKLRRERGFSHRKWLWERERGNEPGGKVTGGEMTSISPVEPTERVKTGSYVLCLMKKRWRRQCGDNNPASDDRGSISSGSETSAGRLSQTFCLSVLRSQCLLF